MEREVIEECLEIALQAPTGSNTQGWQWIFITDPEKKKVIADFYGANYDMYTNRPDQPNYGVDDLRTSQRPKIMDSSRYLREVFHEVPVMMIPCIQGAGRLDTGVPTFGQASAWGSLLPAVWSFMLALRERGLGSAWTTLHLPNEKDVAELLGIPMTQSLKGFSQLLIQRGLISSWQSGYQPALFRIGMSGKFSYSESFMRTFRSLENIAVPNHELHCLLPM